MMTYLKYTKCEDCFKPVTRRLGLLQTHDDYECYSESYVKCFWGLCDHHHKSIENLVNVKPKENAIITVQPVRQDMPMPCASNANHSDLSVQFWSIM